jgi:hypothetical protein
MGAQISISKQDGSVPDKTLPDSADVRYVAPINCAVSSLFNSITTYINNTQVEMSSYYQYQCYLNDVLSFSDLSKMSHMETTGVKLDAGTGDNTSCNNGFLGRSAWFKKISKMEKNTEKADVILWHPLGTSYGDAKSQFCQA